MAGKDFRLLPLMDLSQEQIRSWRQLAQTAIEPNPFFEESYLLPLAFSLRPSARISLAVASSHGRWTACLPVVASSRWHHVPIPSLSTWIAHPLYLLSGTPLVDRDNAREAMSDLLDGLSKANGTHFAGFDLLSEDGPSCRLLKEAIESRTRDFLIFSRHKRAVLFRREQNDYLEQSLSSRRRRELRRELKKLSEAVDGDVTFHDRAGSASAVDRLIELEAKSKLASSGTVLASDPSHSSFFRQVTTGFAEQGRLQVVTLEANDKIIAVLVNLLAGPGVFCLKIAYDEDFSRYSPGIQVLKESVRRFHDETTADWIDSCADANNAMINRLWSDRREFSSVALGTGPGWYAAKPLIKTVRTIRNRKIGEQTDE